MAKIIKKLKKEKRKPCCINDVAFVSVCLLAHKKATALFLMVHILIHNYTSGVNTTIKQISKCFSVSPAPIFFCCGWMLFFCTAPFHTVNKRMPLHLDRDAEAVAGTLRCTSMKHCSRLCLRVLSSVLHHLSRRCFTSLSSSEMSVCSILLSHRPTCTCDLDKQLIVCFVYRPLVCCEAVILFLLKTTLISRLFSKANPSGTVTEFSYYEISDTSFFFLHHNPPSAKEDSLTYYCVLHIVHILNVPLLYISHGRLAKLYPGCRQHNVAQNIVAKIILYCSKRCFLFFSYCFVSSRTNFETLRRFLFLPLRRCLARGYHVVVYIVDEKHTVY